MYKSKFPILDGISHFNIVISMFSRMSNLITNPFIFRFLGFPYFAPQRGPWTSQLQNATSPRRARLAQASCLKEASAGRLRRKVAKPTYGGGRLIDFSPYGNAANREITRFVQTLPLQQKKPEECSTARKHTFFQNRSFSQMQKRLQHARSTEKN